MYRRFLVLLVILFPLVVPRVAMAADPELGKAKGTITINGQSKDLAYAYAWKEPSMIEKGQFNTMVLLSDTKLEDKVVGDRFALTDLARKGKFTGVQAGISPLGNVSSGTIYTAAEDGYFDAIGMHKWEKKSLSDSSIAGRLSTAEPSHFFKTTFAYSATFQAPIRPK